MTEATVAAPDRQSASAGPFKGLRPFDDSDVDALLFFGRDQEREVISANLMASRLTVLYGPSGVGKTSLLAAGVTHHLRRLAERNLSERGHPEFVVLNFSSWSDDPIAGLRDTAGEALGEFFGPAALAEPRRDELLANTLRTWTGSLGCDLLLLLDQVEEYFLYHGQETGSATLVEQLPDLVTQVGLRVSVLLSIREDALAKLDRFKGRIPNLFGNYLRLDHLDREAAQAAIVGPIAEYNRLSRNPEPVEIEGELVEAVLDETTMGRVELGQAGSGVVRGSALQPRIEAPYLQLVLERLWDEETAAGSRALRLTTLQRLGGSVEIVRTHLERALDELSPSQKDIAASLFRYLVTPSGTKIAHAAPDLAEYAAVAEAELAPVISALVKERILRPVTAGNGAGPTGDGSPVEIYHDILADAVLSWRNRHEAQRALDRERDEVERRHRRALAVAAAALVALVVVAAIAVFALLQRRDARKEASFARTEAHRAKAQQLDTAAVAQLSNDPELSLLLALEGARLSPTGQAEDVLRQALIGSRVRAVFRVGAPVVAAAYSPDGHRVLVAGSERRARIFDIRRGRPIVSFETTSRLTDASYSPDGRLVVTADQGGAARIWNAATGRELHVLRHARRVATASFSPNGELVVTASDDGTARVWRAGDGALVTTLRHEGPVRAASFSPDSRLVVTFGRGRSARLFDARSGQLRHVLDQGGRVTSALFATNRLLVTTGANRSARVWGVATGSLIYEVRGHAGPVLDAAVPARGRLLVTVSADGTGRVWNLARGTLLSVLTGHTNYVTDAAFDRKGFTVATASTDRTARTWKPSTGNARAVLAGHTEAVTHVSIRPDGKSVLTGSDDGTARVWDPQTQPELALLARSDGPVRRAAFSPDGRLVAMAAADGARIVRSRSGIGVRRLERDPVTDVAFSPDGSLVAAASGRQVTIWRTQSGARVRVLLHPDEVAAVEFSPDGREIATAANDGSARLWGLGGALVRLLRGHHAALTDVAFSPDGSRLVTASEDKTARIWDRRTGTVEHVLRRHQAAVTCAGFSPDGSSVVTSSRDHDARTWDATTGGPRRVFRGHYAAVNCASFSPDGHWIVTAGSGTAGLWDAASGRRLFYLRGHIGRLTSATFDQAGRRVLTSGADGSVRMYFCDICGRLDDLVALAKARVARTGRTLTPAERRAFLGD